jgi:phospholipase/carboxylesterase
LNRFRGDKPEIKHETTMNRSLEVIDPHGESPVHSLGPADAKTTVVLVHGRGGSARDVLSLANHLPSDVRYVAPQATGHSWYPHSFLASRPENEPWIRSSLEVLDRVVDAVGDDRGVVLLGFSQGACLASEWFLRRRRPIGGLVAIIGGLIGPPGTDWADVPSATLETTKALLMSADPDPHVPFERVRQTQEVLTRIGARVDLHRYPDVPHTILADHLHRAGRLIQDVSARPTVA